MNNECQEPCPDEQTLTCGRPRYHPGAHRAWRYDQEAYLHGVRVSWSNERPAKAKRADR